MPTITDWLMVGTTVVYVIATIFICVFNGRSAKATQDQLVEMRREHRENVRLSIMPYFEINFNSFNPQIHELSSFYYTLNWNPGEEPEPESKNAVTDLNLKNVGKDIATSICIEVEYNNISYHCLINNVTIKPEEEKNLSFILIIPPSELRTPSNLNSTERPQLQLKQAILRIIFDDILGNHYVQTAKVSFQFISKPLIEILTKADTTDSKRCDVSVMFYGIEAPILLGERKEV